MSKKFTCPYEKYERRKLISEFEEEVDKLIEYIKTVNNYQDFDGDLKQCIWIEHLIPLLEKCLKEKWEEKLK